HARPRGARLAARDRPANQGREPLDDRESGTFPAGKHEVAQGNLLVEAAELPGALADPLIPPAKEEDPALPGQVRELALIEPLAVGREQDAPGRRTSPPGF